MVEVLCRVKPEMESHFSSDNVSISTSSDEDVRLQCIRLPWRRSQEFEVDFIVVSGVILVVRKLNQNKVTHV